MRNQEKIKQEICWIVEEKQKEDELLRKYKKAHSAKLRRELIKYLKAVEKWHKRNLSFRERMRERKKRMELTRRRWYISADSFDKEEYLLREYERAYKYRKPPQIRQELIRCLEEEEKKHVKNILSIKKKRKQKRWQTRQQAFCERHIWGEPLLALIVFILVVAISFLCGFILMYPVDDLSWFWLIILFPLKLFSLILGNGAIVSVPVAFIIFIVYFIKMLFLGVKKIILKIRNAVRNRS